MFQFFFPKYSHAQWCGPSRPLTDMSQLKTNKLGRAPFKDHFGVISRNFAQQFWRRRRLKIYANFPILGPFLALKTKGTPSNTYTPFFLQ